MSDILLSRNAYASWRPKHCPKSKICKRLVFKSQHRQHSSLISLHNNTNPIVYCSTEIAPQEEEQERKHDIVAVRIERVTRNIRRISASVAIGGVPLQTVWDVLTDYEGLAEFIPGLATSQVLEKRENGAQLLQIGEQDVGLGVKFRAKGIIEVTEAPIELLDTGIRRVVLFEMVQGDFKLFHGSWTIEQNNGSEQTILSYTLEVQPKIWVPVGLVEGRLGKEVETNLTCVRNRALQLSNPL